MRSRLGDVHGNSRQGQAMVEGPLRLWRCLFANRCSLVQGLEEAEMC